MRAAKVGVVLKNQHQHALFFLAVTFLRYLFILLALLPEKSLFSLHLSLYKKKLFLHKASTTLSSTLVFSLACDIVGGRAR